MGYYSSKRIQREELVKTWMENKEDINYYLSIIKNDKKIGEESQNALEMISSILSEMSSLMLKMI